MYTYCQVYAVVFHHFIFCATQGIFGVGQSTAKFYNKETSVKVRFKYVLKNSGTIKHVFRVRNCDQLVANASEN